MAKRRLLEIFLFKLGNIAKENVQCYRDVVLIQAVFEHVVHEEVNLIHAIELLDIACGHS